MTKPNVLNGPTGIATAFMTMEGNTASEAVVGWDVGWIVNPWIAEGCLERSQSIYQAMSENDIVKG